ncbi:SelB C-terminal domain-containing protein [Knoellia sp. CPCC 206450]|uniref:SelB domain-containing protein n=1 Tax=Knoellia tibetensis TaxID=3404798 RepID=UPI003B437908
MRWVLATAGHVDHGKSTLVQALTGRNPDRLAEERSRGLTIELGFAWTTLPDGHEVAFVDVPGHQRFLGTMLAGLGPTPAVVFVVAADRGWQAQSAEHLAAVEALGIRDGVLVVTRCDLADRARSAEAGAVASERLSAAGLDVPVVHVSAVTGEGLDTLRSALSDLMARLPEPDPGAPVRLWTDRAFSVAGAGTVVTGTLGSGTVSLGDVLDLVDDGSVREVAVRGLHSQDEQRERGEPVSRVAVNLRRVDSGAVSRSAVLVTPGAFALATVVDAAVVPVRDAGQGRSSSRPKEVPDRAVLHVGSVSQRVAVRSLGEGHARLTSRSGLPWRVGDRAILRDPSSRDLWSVRVLDVDPLPLRRRGAAVARGDDLGSGLTAAQVRLASRGADHAALLDRLGLTAPSEAVEIGRWRLHPSLLADLQRRLAGAVADHHAVDPLSAGLTVVEALHRLGLPAHLRPVEDGGTLSRTLEPPGHELVTHLARESGLILEGGRLRDPRSSSDLGPAEAAVAVVEDDLRRMPFAAPDRDRLAELGLGAAALAAAARTGRLLRLADDVVLLPDGPARAMQRLSALDQPFTLSEARQALGTTRRVAVPLLEHLDGRGWTRRVDERLRAVVRAAS